MSHELPGARTAAMIDMESIIGSKGKLHIDAKCWEDFASAR